jgi:carboxyl-terminal processing protease
MAAPNRPSPSEEAGVPASGEITPVLQPGPETEELGDFRPPRPRRRRTLDPSRLSLLLVAVLAGAALFVGGFSLGSRVATTPGTPASEEARFAPFWDVYSLIQSQFAGSPKPSPDQLVEAAIKGMMESLNDPFSYYESPEDFANSLLSVGGQAQGIGVTIQLQPIEAGASIDCSKDGPGCELAIQKVIPDSPAEAAGLQAGDVIAKVDGASLDGLTIDDIYGKIKGQKDTPVTLTILRNGETFDVTIVRKVFNKPEVTTKVLANGAVEYIAIAGINPPASSQFDLALADALAAGRRSIIMDLRDNGGGYVPDAVKIASEFVESGPLLYQQDAHGNQTEIDASPGGRATDGSVKLVILMDKNTASAAEIVAGALQARGVAKLIGTVSYGKGIVQEWLPLPNNAGGIHLTTARWLTPDHVWIQGKGLNPDIPATTAGARAGTDPVLDAGLVALGYQPESTASPSPASSPSPNGSAPAVPSASPAPTLLPSPSAS